MASTPAGLSVLVNRPGLELGNKQTPDIFTDAREYTNQAVRFCDLDLKRDT